MTDHFKEKHADIEMPQALAEEVALRYHEREATSQLLTKFPRSVKIECRAQCACEDHAFRDVDQTLHWTWWCASHYRIGSVRLSETISPGWRLHPWA